MKRLFLFCSLSLVTLLGQDVSSSDPKQRAKAAKEAIKSGPQGIERIKPLLSDQDVNVRIEAVKAIVEIGSQHSLEPLVQALNDNDAEVQIRATDGLVNFYLPGYVKSGLSGTINRAGNIIRSKFRTESDDRVIDSWIDVRPEIVTALGKTLSDASNADVRANAARALGILRGSGALDNLHDALRTKDSRIMFESLIALQKIRDPRSASSVSFLFRDPEDKVAVAALETAGLLRDRSAFSEIEAIYRRGPSMPVKRAALAAMAMLGDERGRSYFIEAFPDRDDQIRTAAAEGIARLKDPNQIANLNNCFDDERKMPPRLACAFGLVMVGRTQRNETSALTYLINSLNLKSWKGVAEPYLVELARSKDVRMQLEQAIGGATKDEKVSLARILSVSGDQDSATVLERLTRDPEPEVMEEGVRALRNLRARLP